MKTNQIGGVMGAVRFGPVKTLFSKLPSPNPSFDPVYVCIVIIGVVFIYYSLVYGPLK